MNAQSENNLPDICGFNNCSDAGADNFVPVIFLPYCNLRCPYCMNADLVLPNSEKQAITINEIRNKIEDLKSEMLIISGGEPTCTGRHQLTNLILEIKSWGIKVGMATNGTNSHILKSILPHLSFVAMDLKANYETAPSEGVDFHPVNDVIASKALLTTEKDNRKDFDYELRTTLYPIYVDTKEINDLGSIIRKDERWVLQQFRHAPKMIDRNCHKVRPYNQEKLNKLLLEAKKYTNNVELRWV